MSSNEDIVRRLRSHRNERDSIIAISIAIHGASRPEPLDDVQNDVYQSTLSALHSRPHTVPVAGYDPVLEKDVFAVAVLYLFIFIS